MPDVRAFDVDLHERGRNAHVDLVRCIAERLRNAGLQPCAGVIRPRIEADVAWWAADGELNLVEVKSTHEENAADQLRLGLGQLLDYRTRARSCTGDVAAYLAVDGVPGEHWHRVCSSVGVVLLDEAALSVWDPKP